MVIRVLFFGVLKELAGTSAESLRVEDQASLGDVLQHYEEQVPRFREYASSLAISINQEYARLDARLNPDDEVAFLPPVSGGSNRPKRAMIIREKIDPETALAIFKQPSDGATLVFDGVVRDNTRGRRTLYLEYEAYEEMALKQMEGLIDQAMEQFKIRDAAIIHRLGRLEIGESSVLIAVASAHRAAAFEACRWLIDTLKRTVPIWKKEYFEDGAVWADGEPFPEELRAPIPEGRPSK